ncbi:MAG TPA: hypothetical protein VF075_10270 [Pyrinomonadaceae bacterium]
MSYKRLIASLALLICALCAVSVQAQSGRRQNKPEPAAPVPTPTPEPTPVAKKREGEAELVLLVATDRISGDSWIPFSYYNAAQQGCAERLRRAASVDVDVAERDMTRGEAIKKAKSQTKTYVVLLSIQTDRMSNNQSLELDFTVFEPTTANVVITGRSYLNERRTGPVVIGPTGRTSQVFYERYLKQAGEDIADRILKKLHITPR